MFDYGRLLRVSIVALLAGTAVSGCSLGSLFGGGSTGSASTNQTVVDVNGDGSISPGEKALFAYNRTDADGTYSSITEAQQSGAGISGFGIGSGAPSAIDSAGTYKTASIKMASDKKTLQISVDGQSYTLNSVNTTPATLTVNGKNYEVYGFGYSLAQNQQTVSGNIGATLNGQYSSLAYFLKNVQVNTTTGRVEGYDGMALVATGLETPVGQLPTQVVQYGGNYYVVVGADSGGGTFSATVDFAAKSLTGIADGTNIQGTLNGNKFSGDLTGTMTGTVAGAFYGPHAEEMAGAGSGTINGNGASAFFIGNKN